MSKLDREAMERRERMLHLAISTGQPGPFVQQAQKFLEFVEGEEENKNKTP